MGLLYTLAFFGAVIGLWRRVAVNLEAQGRGWYFRNVIAGTTSLFIGIVVLLFATADSTLASLIGFVLALASTAAPWWPTESLATTTASYAPLPVVPVPSVPVVSEELDPIGTITFDYIDARGNESHRTVEVTAVDDEYFEGLCFTAGETRTFVIGRVQGKVMDVSTGKLLTARQWAAQARKHPLNGIVSMGGEWNRDEHNSPADNAQDSDAQRPTRD